MKLPRLILLISALLLGAATALAAASTVLPAPGNTPPTVGSWYVMDMGVIGAASQDALANALERVKTEQGAGLIIRLDTPGGSLENTREMVKQILGSETPIVVWVGPAGARAGSAGAFITLAAHVAAMAPGTNIGAAHPVDSMGKNLGKSLSGDKSGAGDDESSDMRAKITNDTLAFIEGIAKQRGRNVEMARSFVATSTSITDEEALSEKVIDLRARDLGELMTLLDGRVVPLSPARSVMLATKGAPRVEIERTVRQRLLEILSNPNLFYLLFLAGLIGLGYELTHPGIFFPGVAGAICLILALISMSVLPISYGAIALILVGIALMVAEAHLPTFGAAGIGGVVAFVLGSVFLVDPSNTMGLRISWFVIAPGAITSGGAFVTLGYLVLRARRMPVQSGREGIVGEPAVALSDFKGETGSVRVSGAIWTARLTAGAAPVARGEILTVRGVRGLELDVSKP